MPCFFLNMQTELYLLFSSKLWESCEIHIGYLQNYRKLNVHILNCIIFVRVEVYFQH